MCLLCGAIEEKGGDPGILGAGAFFAYLTGQPLRASMLVETLRRQHGRGGLYAAISGWCDTILPWIVPNQTREGRDGIRLVWRDITTGLVTSAEATPPVARWAGQILAARAARDEASSLALFEAVADDELVSHADELLKVLALQIYVRHADGAA